MGEERKKRESFPLTEDEDESRTWVTDLMAFWLFKKIDDHKTSPAAECRVRGHVGSRLENLKDDDKSI